MLQDRLNVSERRACRIAGQNRSTQRHQGPRLDRDDALRRGLREISRAHPRWGYRKAWVLLRTDGWQVNRKRIQRLWREEGLRVPSRRRKRRRIGVSTASGARIRAEHENHVWAFDFQFDTTSDGRILKLLHVVDEHTREALWIEVARRIDADATVAVLERIAQQRGAPTLVRMDNGPEMTAHAIRDWCRTTGAGTSYIEPGSPWENPFVESFASRVRDEVLGVEIFDTLLEARVVIEDWRTEYNTLRPHSSLQWLAPAAYAASCRGD